MAGKACLLDPLSSKGVLRATMSGIAAGHLIANVLDRCIAAEAAANAYQHWLSEWPRKPASRHSIDSSELPASPTGRGDPKKERDYGPGLLTGSTVLRLKSALGHGR